MGILSTIFGGGDIIAKGMQLIDDLHTSDDEEIAAKAKAKVDLLTAYSGYKVAQRVLAFMFASTYLGSFIVITGMTLYQGAGIEGMRAVLNEFYIGPIMLTIVGFYFGGGAIEGVKRQFKNKSK